jgi:hypothetical protein
MSQPPPSVLFNPDVSDAMADFLGLAIGARFFGLEPTCQHSSIAVETNAAGAPLTINRAELTGLFGMQNGANLLGFGQREVAWRSDGNKILAQHGFEHGGVATIQRREELSCGAINLLHCVCRGRNRAGLRKDHC